LNNYVEHEKEFRERKINRLKDEGNLTPKMKKNFDYIEKFQTEFDAEVKKIAPKKPTSKKEKPKKSISEKKSSTKKEEKTTTKKSSKKSAKTKSETQEYTEEFFHNLYHEETGKEAIWRGSITKIYLKWLEKKKEELGVK
jgi:hypothetical protein